MSYIVKKSHYNISFVKNDKGVICTLSNDLKPGKSLTFCLVDPGNVFMLDNKNWNMLDTSSIPQEREFQDFIDKGSYDLIKSVQAFSNLVLRNDQSVFLETLSYDLFTNIYKLKAWVPGKGSAEYIDLSEDVIAAVYEDGSKDYMPKTKDEKFNIYTPKTRENMEEEELSISLEVPETDMKLVNNKSNI